MDAHFTEVAALQRTMAVLGAESVGGAAARPGGAARLAEVLGEVAAGYAQALQDRTRSEQEQITAAAFAARVAAEEARWNSEARLEAVFAESVIGIAVAEIDGRILEVNRALCDMLGFTAAEITGRTFWEFVHPDDAPGFWEQVEDLLAGAGEPPADGKAVLPQGRRGDLDRSRALARPRSRGEPAVRRRDDREHHRAVSPAERSPAPGPARSADRTAQPNGVLPTPGRGTAHQASRSASAIWTSTGSRPSTTPSAMTGAMSCCRPWPND